MNLLAAGTDLHRITKVESGLLERLDACRQIGHAKDDSVPSPWFLPPAVGHVAGSGGARAAEEEIRAVERHAREGGQLLMLQLEAELSRVEVDRAAHIADLIPDAVKGAHERRDFGSLDGRC